MPVVVTSSASEQQARLSPDGRLAAYVSTESGVGEVYVAGFPRPGERVRVSLGGGRGPRWRGDGGELFYLAADDSMMAAELAVRDGRIQVSAPRRLFVAPPLSGRLHGSFDVSPDGERFLLNVSTRESVAPGLPVESLEHPDVVGPDRDRRGEARPVGV